MPQAAVSVKHGNMPLTDIYELQYTVALSSRLSKNYAKWRDGRMSKVDFSLFPFTCLKNSS